MIGSVFMDDYIILRYRLPFDFYVYYLIFIISIIYYIRSFSSITLIPRWFTYAITALIITTLFLTIYDDTFGLGVIKQIVGVLFTSIAYYTFIAYNNFEVKRIFRMYVFLAIFVAIEGLIEEVLNLNGIHINEKMRETTSGFYRIFGIAGEPYFLAVILLPAMYFAFYKMTIFERINSKFNNYFIVIILFTCFVFTFSSAGFIGIAGIFIFWLYNKKYLSFTSWKIILLPIFLALFALAFSNLQSQWKEFNIKFNQTLNAFATNSTKKEDINELNTSSFALYSNYTIAKASFLERPLTGTGLGTHEANYKKYFSKFFDEDFIVRYGVFNNADANSMFVRLMSETGLMGLILFFTFMFKNFLFRKGYDNPLLRDYILINQSIFIWFIVRLVRTGNYFGNGFFLFFFLYYLSYRIVKDYYKRDKLKREIQTDVFSVS
ncbi:MAG: O-antigen ligase family protein [Bacteroidia bacterium]|nr:O-antigen ligase family protein [Bacteroidia bacterium]